MSREQADAVHFAVDNPPSWYERRAAFKLPPKWYSIPRDGGPPMIPMYGNRPWLWALGLVGMCLGAFVVGMRWW